MKLHFTLLLVGSVMLPLSGQVIIVPTPHQEGYFTLEDVWRVTLISAQQQPVSAILEVTIEDAQHQPVLSGSSPVFNVLPGSNRPFWKASGQQFQYGSGSVTNILRSTGRFPYGNYIICYRLIHSGTGALIGEFCQEESVKPFSPPELLYPYNGEVISTRWPLLTWKPPFPPGQTPFEYFLRLVEVKKNQEAVEALETNIPILSRRGISGTTLPYPGDAPALEMEKTYAWQVIAKAGDFELGATEVWVFKLSETTQADVMAPSAAIYRELKNSPGGSYNPIQQKVRFAYDNRWDAPNLDYTTALPTSNLEKAYYKIFPAGKQASPITMSSSITLLAGVNKLSIDLQGISGINHGENYILVLRDPTGKEYSLEFTYYN